MADHVDRVLAQWQEQRPDLDASPMGVVGRLSRASRLLERGLQDNFARFGLQHGEFDLLATLRRAGPPFELTAGQLVAASMVTSGAVTNRVDRLVAKRLVDRRHDPDNRRQVLIRLTDAGRQLIDEAVAAHVQHEDALLAGLTERDRAQVARLLRKLLLSLGDQAGDPVLSDDG